MSKDELNERLWAWLDIYHRTDHSSLGTTPLLRGQRDIEHFRQLPPATDFCRLFFHRLDRVVGKPQGTARLVDPVVNAQSPSAKSSKVEPEPTGINFVDLLIKKKDEEE